MLIGAYTFGNIAEKYITGDASFTWEEIKGDLFTVAMTGASMWGSAKDFGTSYCFVAGTLVTTEDGFKPIEEIEVGDKVLSEDEFTGEVAVKKVTKTFVNETNELIHIHVNGETISATPTHPFYVDKLGWTLAGSLRAGDVLVLSNGELVTVEFVQHEILESPIKVYNFEVEDFHTYFVGECGVLVHNECTDFYQTGRDGEIASGINKNTEHIESINGTAKYRIPDGLDKDNKILSEVKNVKKQSYTKQIKDFVDYSKKYDYQFELYVRKSTKLTGPLQEQVNLGNIILKYLP